MERFSFIFLVAGIGCFAFAFVVAAWFPMIPVRNLHVRTVEELASVPPASFAELKVDYPEAFSRAYGDVPLEQAFAQALQVGHDAYIGEGCWHCHSQQVRPWGSDEAQYGPVSFPEEYHNELNMPPLWGTRRIGPDLIRRGELHSNDWHVAHFWHPPDVNPGSVMPDYPWLFDADEVTPNAKGLSLIAYVQWLGTWVSAADETIYAIGAIERDSPRPRMVEPEAGKVQ